MVDETLYRETVLEVNDLPCIFSKALFFGCANCECAQRKNIAEREIIECNQWVKYQQCTLFWKTLQEKCLFIQPVGKLLTHSKAMKMQCGSMQSLQLEITLEITQKPNVAQLLEKTLEIYQNIENLPYQTMVRTITHFPFRSRRRNQS